MRVAVIGSGAMGRWFASFAKGSGWEVALADIDAERARGAAEELGVGFAATNVEAAEGADLVIVAVPISKTPGVIKEVAPHMRSGAMLADIASAKGDVVSAMREVDADIELVSLHPLFGPGATTPKGKDFIAVPVRPGGRYELLKRHLISLGARVTEMGAEEHDRLMAVVQALTHFVLISYIAALRSMRESKEALLTPTPLSSALLELGKAVLAGNPDVYGEVQVYNRYAQLARSMLMEACGELDVALAAHDVKAVRKIFKEAARLFDEEATRAAYERLYKRFEVGRG